MYDHPCLTADIAAWVSETVGCPVTSVDQIVGGYSRKTFAVLAGDRALIARVDTADGPFAGTDMSLRREATIYRALNATALPIPTLVATKADGSALLFDRSPGIPELHTLDSSSQASVISDYIDQLARLHSLDLASIGIDVLDRRAAVHAELDRWESILDARTTRSWDVARLGLRLLRDHVPLGDGSAVLCHGDAGPKNFLHDGKQVTALLDWEFWHLGDPADDLAWWVFRAHQRGHGGGDLAAQLSRWQHTSGRPLYAADLRYYTAVVLARALIIVAAGLDQHIEGIDQTVFLALVPMLSVHLLHGLAGLTGVEVELPAAPREDPAAALADEALAIHRRNYPGHAPNDAALQAASATSGRFMEHLAALVRFGHDITQAELADEADLRDPVAPDTADAQAIRMALRREYRRGWLWPSTLSQTTAPPVAFEDFL